MGALVSRNSNRNDLGFEMGLFVSLNGILRVSIKLSLNWERKMEVLSLLIQIGEGKNSSFVRYSGTLPLSSGCQ